MHTEKLRLRPETSEGCGDRGSERGYQSRRADTGRHTGVEN